VEKIRKLISFYYKPNFNSESPIFIDFAYYAKADGRLEWTGESESGYIKEDEFYEAIKSLLEQKEDPNVVKRFKKIYNKQKEV